MKTKTILIKCEVPEDFPINNYIRVATVEISGVDGNGDRYHADYSAEIITPPTEEEVKQTSCILGSTATAKIWQSGSNWYKKRLGL